MPARTTGPVDCRPLLRRIGEAIRSEREGRGWSRADLARRSGISLRFLAQVEAGEGNIAVTRLDGLARGLEISLLDLIVRAESRRADPRETICLWGLRGAGKSTLGRRLAERLGVPFQEHDQLVEDAAGLGLQEIFAIHGEGLYRRLSRETLLAFLDRAAGRSVLAAGGGIVEDASARRALLDRTTVVWLTAEPADHLARVEAQGDRRPMRDRPNAMGDLRRLLRSRARLYAGAHHTVATSGRAVEDVVGELAALCAPIPNPTSAR